ncbi:sensor histidine kinase [Actinomadura hibisca]|uniref:sensor histidine kinase n=1 Tax=Actinomadura hibisca TaxID=68565 RepID=UPI0008315A49|nr:sensor histidine kinase [Actinomadura hibisca]
MDVATTAGLEELDSRRLENYQRITDRSFVFAGAGILLPAMVITIVEHFDGKNNAVWTVPAAVGAALLAFWFYVRLVRAGLGGGASRRELALAGAATVPAALMMFVHPVWAAVPIGMASAVALSPMTRRGLVVLSVGTGVVTGVLATLAARYLYDGDRPFRWYLGVLLIVVLTAVAGAVVFVNRYQRRMWELHQQAHSAREALARVAVTEERMRFSRDLHDLLGHSLSLIAVKSELAIRMADADPERAKAEMADVRRAARDSLREVRAAVRGYRAVELDAELAGVRAVLEAAGVRCEATVPPADLPADVRAVLAWVIREGATNIIKHSEARRCEITLSLYGGSVVLEMSNDGARVASVEADGLGLAASAAADGPGSGLAGLSERIEVVGGTFAAGPQGRDGFLLRAVVPMPRGDVAGAAEAAGTAGAAETVDPDGTSKASGASGVTT